MTATPENVAAGRLFWIRVAHTAAWWVFAPATLAIPVALAFGSDAVAAWLSLVVWVEVAILLVNGMACPLTGIAARYTDDRSDNFDIFLPRWLARNNKRIFGTIFAASEVWLAARWFGAAP